MHFNSCISCFKYKCHIINFLLTSLLGMYREILDLRLFVQSSICTKDLGPIFLCTDLVFVKLIIHFANFAFVAKVKYFIDTFISDGRLLLPVALIDRH
jgi:hypothetical protein